MVKGVGDGPPTSRNPQNSYMGLLLIYKRKFSVVTLCPPEAVVKFIEYNSKLCSSRRATQSRHQLCRNLGNDFFCWAESLDIYKQTGHQNCISEQSLRTNTGPVILLDPSSKIHPPADYARIFDRRSHELRYVPVPTIVLVFLSWVPWNT